MAKITTITNPLTGQPAQVDQLDHTAQQIDDGLNIARGVSNPNLLDNWYFGSPVDQRQGRVVVPNTTYYSDNQLTTSAGTTSAYVTAYRYATGTASGVNYASFKLIDTDTAPTYYAAPENVVRGYTGTGYGPDRWKSLNDNLSIIINLDGTITLKNNTAFDSWFIQLLDTPEIFRGKKLTLSVLGTAKTGNCYINLYDGTDNLVAVTENGISTLTKVVGASATVLQFVFYIQGNSELTIKAAKLELGSQQTLAHQENGVWVLNEIPDYGEQLARCQRYHFEFGPSHALIAYDAYGVNSPVVYFPVQMRTVTPIKVYSKAGTENAISYWNGSAEVDFTEFILEWNENFVVLRSNGKFTPGGIYIVGKLIAYADL